MAYKILDRALAPPSDLGDVSNLQIQDLLHPLDQSHLSLIHGLAQVHHGPSLNLSLLIELRQDVTKMVLLEPRRLSLLNSLRPETAIRVLTMEEISVHRYTPWSTLRDKQVSTKTQ